MSLRFETAPTAADWNARIAANPGLATMFQSFELGEVKRMARWTPKYAVSGEVAMTIHQKPAPGLGKVWYLPKGPIVADLEQLRTVLVDLREAGRAEGVLLVKIEPEIVETPEALAELESLGLVRTPPVQPHDSTVLVDISGSEEDVLASFTAKTRNMVRRAIRDGVVVTREDGTEDTFDQMWDLWKGVVADQELAVRGRDYHVNSWRAMVADGLGQIFFARTDDGQLVASALVTVIGEVACYREGASLRDRPVPGASQLVQYEAMRWAMERGAGAYDLCGVPHSSQVGDKDHHRYGLGLFKRGFNKEVTDWVGAYDLVLRPRRYAVWNRIGQRVIARLQRREPGDTFW